MALRRTEFRADPDKVAAWNERSRQKQRDRAAARRPVPGQPINSLRLASSRELVEVSDKPRPELAAIPPRYSSFRPKRGSSFREASPEQRAFVEGKLCVACGGERGVLVCDPAHLTPQGGGWGGCTDWRCVVPLCRICHDIFDGRISAPNDPVDLAPILALDLWLPQRIHMSSHMDYVTALQRLSGCKYAPIGETTLMGAPLTPGPEAA